jgi:hypothetical protein
MAGLRLAGAAFADNEQIHLERRGHRRNGSTELIWPLVANSCVHKAIGKEGVWCRGGSTSVLLKTGHFRIDWLIQGGSRKISFGTDDFIKRLHQQAQVIRSQNHACIATRKADELHPHQDPVMRAARTGHG